MIPARSRMATRSQLLLVRTWSSRAEPGGGAAAGAVAARLAPLPEPGFPFLRDEEREGRKATARLRLGGFLLVKVQGERLYNVIRKGQMSREEVPGLPGGGTRG